MNENIHDIFRKYKMTFICFLRNYKIFINDAETETIFCMKFVKT